MIRYLYIAIVIASLFNFSGTAHALSPDEVMKKAQAAFLYPGKDSKIRVMMRLISREGKERVREMTMLRKNFGEAGGDQKYFIYFYQPSDVRDMTFMVWKYPKKDDDRWLFIPALNMVRRIAASDRRSNFVGSDFTYEDISGRDIEDDTHSIVKEEKVGDRDCYLIKSVPMDEKGTDYAYKLSWIDKERWLPLKELYYGRDGSVVKQFSADEVMDIAGFWTATKRTMKNLVSGHRTEVTFQKTEYNLNIEDDLFTERFLKKPPKRWIE
ncbi:MAG: outer membrane lipoprotein-sorting protein [Deltaproteobacteria bacterium]|nr:outer membrane lipoprotein-sorting protein [Deltaproteobacteria bacterium]